MVKMGVYCEVIVFKLVILFIMYNISCRILLMIVDKLFFFIMVLEEVIKVEIVRFIS